MRLTLVGGVDTDFTRCQIAAACEGRALNAQDVTNQSGFRSFGIGNALLLVELTRFLRRTGSPPRIKSGAGFRRKTL